jgi:hypothetical protein
MASQRRADGQEQKMANDSEKKVFRVLQLKPRCREIQSSLPS